MQLANDLSAALPEGVYGTVDASGLDQQGLQPYVRQRGKDLYAEDGGLGFDRTDLRDWFVFWAQLRDSGGATPADVTFAGQGGAETDVIINGDAAMSFGYENALYILQQLTDDTLGIAIIPNGPPGSPIGQYLTTGVLLSASASTAYPDAAARVIDFFANDPEAIRIMGLSRGVPPTEEARELVAPDLNEAEATVVAFMGEVADYVADAALPPSLPTGAGEVKELLTRVANEVAFGQQTIDQGVDTFFAEAESILG